MGHDNGQKSPFWVYSWKKDLPKALGDPVFCKIVKSHFGPPKNKSLTQHMTLFDTMWKMKTGSNPVGPNTVLEVARDSKRFGHFRLFRGRFALPLKLRLVCWPSMLVSFGPKVVIMQHKWNHIFLKNIHLMLKSAHMGNGRVADNLGYLVSEDRRAIRLTL